jgi:hypothetical protein
VQRHKDTQLLAFNSSSIKPVTYALGYLNSPETIEQHASVLKKFFLLLGLEGKDLDEQGLAFLNQVRQSKRGSQWASQSIKLFVDSLKQRMHDNTSNDSSRKKDEITAGTIENYFRKIKFFYETCQEEEGEEDLPTINWKRLARILPKARKSSSDRAPTREEIRKAVQAQDKRARPIILVMCSSGIRLGAWDYLRWKHVTAIKNDKGEIIAAKLIVYAGEYEEYYTYITPEAYHALQEYMEFRRYHGENITGESWLVRNIWQISDVKIKRGGKMGLASSPQKITIDAIKVIIIRALYEQGVREALPEGQRRHEFKGAHGFRKFFKTHAEQVMNHSNVELLMGHTSEALQRSYYKPREEDILQDYLKAVDLLTINDDKTTLQKQVAELTEKSEEANYIIKGKLAEKEKEIEAAAREAEKTKKMLEEIQLQQEIQKAEHEIDQANHQNLARYVMGLEKSIIINVYDEEDGTQGLLELGAKLRREREAREEKHQQRQRAR